MLYEVVNELAVALMKTMDNMRKSLARVCVAVRMRFRGRAWTLITLPQSGAVLIDNFLS
jgi:hypothetical protein